MDTPGKVVVHVRILNARIFRVYLCDVMPTSQLNHKANTSIGVENIRESILITHFVTDEDGSLKIKQVEEFTDSKVELDFTQAVAARAKEQQCPSCV